MNLKPLLLGIIMVLSIAGCTKDNDFTSSEPETNFLNSAEQERLWKEVINSSSNTQNVSVGKKGACTEEGMYFRNTFVSYTGGGKGNTFSRFIKVLIKRYELSIIYRSSNENPCPEFRLPRFPRITYNQDSDDYSEEWESYSPRGGEPGGRTKSFDVDGEEEEGEEESDN